MRMLNKIGIIGGLVCVGVVLGLWIPRPTRVSNVDLGAAPPRYVPAGTLTIVDSSGVELATLFSEEEDGHNSVIQFYNGPDGYLGQYVGNTTKFGGIASLFVYGPMKEGRASSLGVIRFMMGPSDAHQVESTRPDTSGQVDIPVKAAYKPPRFSERWWLRLFSSGERHATLQSELPSEDTRLVHRDGKPFAVCGHDLYGMAGIVFVSSDYNPQARMYFQLLQGNLAALTFEVFDRKREMVALLETADSPRGPRLSIASEDRLSITGSSLFPLDPTGMKLNPNSMPPWPNDGVVDWLGQPMYRARLPIRLADTTGKVIWSSGKAGVQ